MTEDDKGRPNGDSVRELKLRITAGVEGAGEFVLVQAVDGGSVMVMLTDGKLAVSVGDQYGYWFRQVKPIKVEATADDPSSL